jgi:hypothetical protein
MISLVKISIGPIHEKGRQGHVPQWKCRHKYFAIHKVVFSTSLFLPMRRSQATGGKQAVAFMLMMEEEQNGSIPSLL